VILSASSLSGTAGSINDDMPFLNALLRTPTPTQQAIYFVKGNSFEGAGTTPNQMAVGGAIDTLPLGNSLFDQLAVLDTTTAVNALQSMTGEFHASTKSALVEQSSTIQGSINDRFAQAFAGGGTVAPLGYADDGVVGGLGVPAKTGPGVWVQGF